MNIETITNPAGFKFYVEQSADFDDDGRMKAGRGWYAGQVIGNDFLGGVFFDTREQAIDAITEYREAA